jgi:mono/diheme cytochrome c family protein
VSRSARGGVATIGGAVLMALSLVLTPSCGAPITGSQQFEQSRQESFRRLSDPGFSALKEAVFGPSCVGCHAQYDSYSGVRREIESIAIAVASGRMPKAGGPLSEDRKELLRSWIAAGAPEFSGQPPSPPEPIDLRPRWEAISANILFPKCLVCHNPRGQARFLDLSSRESIRMAADRPFGSEDRKLIDFLSPESSYLIEIVRDAQEPMPPAWSSIRRLDGSEVGALAEWIRAGLP